METPAQPYPAAVWRRCEEVPGYAKWGSDLQPFWLPRPPKPTPKHSHSAEVPQLAVVAFTPGKHLPVDGQGRGVAATCKNDRKWLPGPGAHHRAS